MNSPIKVSSVLLFLGLPALWFGSFSISEQISVADLSPNFEFVPVAVHASHFADYSTDALTNSFAPVDEDIVIDAQADQGLPPTITVIQPATQTPTPKADSDESENQGASAQPTAAPNDPGQGQSQSGDNGNKDKGADSPGNSGSDHGGGNGIGNGKKNNPF